MNILQKIFTPGSSTKKKSLLHGDQEVRERQSHTSPKASASTRIKRKSTTENSDGDSCGPLVQSVSLTVISDPVPTSFKTNSSFANQSRQTQGTASPKSVHLAGSLSNASYHLDRHHQHTSTQASSVSRHNQRSLFDRMQNSGSFALGDTTVAGGSSSANGCTVNLWRLPWTQQKVTMCPHCHRPRQRDRNTHVSRASYSVQQTGSENGMGDDMSEANDDMSYGDLEDMGGPTGESVTYCRCGAAVDGDTPPDHDNSIESAEERPQVFVVETQNPRKVLLRGPITNDSVSDSDGDEDHRRSYKLSLVSSLTSASLRRRAPHVQPTQSTDPPQSSSTSVPRSVSHWLHEQEASEAPALSSPKGVR
ncbi:hypothetical protein, conserved [Leishmania lindenbergi]|uniref:Uncharacterized protein n=1 Tax=Leishmania lindenbergi TaxID=651832 RepID=A0AAW3AHE9_9TRYP